MAFGESTGMDLLAKRSGSKKNAVDDFIGHFCSFLFPN